MREYGVTLTDLSDVKDADCVVLAVGHKQFLELDVDTIEGLFNQAVPTDQRIIIDIKSILDKETFTEKGYHFWRL